MHTLQKTKEERMKKKNWKRICQRASIAHVPCSALVFVETNDNLCLLYYSIFFYRLIVLWVLCGSWFDISCCCCCCCFQCVLYSLLDFNGLFSSLLDVWLCGARVHVIRLFSLSLSFGFLWDLLHCRRHIYLLFIYFHVCYIWCIQFAFEWIETPWFRFIWWLNENACVHWNERVYVRCVTW